MGSGDTIVNCKLEAWNRGRRRLLEAGGGGGGGGGSVQYSKKTKQRKGRAQECDMCMNIITGVIHALQIKLQINVNCCQDTS